jgi:hypothetical protein
VLILIEPESDTVLKADERSYSRAREVFL